MMKNYSRFAKLSMLFLLLIAGAAFAVPKKITFQGKLLNNSGTPINNSGQGIRFSLYSAASGGSALWTDAFVVNVVDGIYTVVLGSANVLNLPFDQDYYLGVRAGSDAEMTPRVALSSVAYAFRADTANVSKIADSATYALSAQSAGTATVANSAAFADSTRIAYMALHSDSATYLRNMPNVDSVRAAFRADTSKKSGVADTARKAGVADTAKKAGTAQFASTSGRSDTSGIADTATYSWNTWNSTLLAGNGIGSFVFIGDTVKIADTAIFAKNSNLFAGYGVGNFVQKGGDTARYADTAEFASTAWNSNQLAGFGVGNFVQRGDTRNIQLDSLRLTKSFVFDKGVMNVISIDTNGVVINSGLSVNNSLNISAGDLSLTSGSRILLNGREIDPGYQVTLDTLLASATNSDLNFYLLGGNIDVQESYFEVKVIALDYNSISAHTFEISIDGGTSFGFVDTTGYNRPYFMTYELKIWNSIRYATLVPVEFTSSFYGMNDKTLTLPRPGGGLKEVTLRTNAGFQSDTRVIVTRIKR